MESELVGPLMIAYAWVPFPLSMSFMWTLGICMISWDLLRFHKISTCLCGRFVGPSGSNGYCLESTDPHGPTGEVMERPGEWTAWKYLPGGSRPPASHPPGRRCFPNLASTRLFQGDSPASVSPRKISFPHPKPATRIFQAASPGASGGPRWEHICFWSGQRSANIYENPSNS